uniref:Inhibitor I9 domain-containing protein n=1 Tax=Oryza brachyantha TaxID=4533 RepID=J3MTY8_ORYBR
MAHLYGRVALVLVLLLAAGAAGGEAATPRQLFLVTQAPVTLTNHHGQLLTGNYSVNLLWYGRFTPAQRATVADFLLSLSSPPAPSSSPAAAGGGPAPPSVASWWATTASSSQYSFERHLRSKNVDTIEQQLCEFGIPTLFMALMSF